MSYFNSLNKVINQEGGLRPDSPSITDQAIAPSLETPVSKKLLNDLIISLGPPTDLSIALAGLGNSILSQASMDPDTAVLILMDMIGKSGEASVKNSKESLVNTFTRSEKLGEERVKKLKESFAKLDAAAIHEKDAQTSSDIALGFSVAGAVFGMLAAILLTMFTLGGGAAAIVGAAIGLTTAILDVGTRIAKATGATYDDPTDPTGKKKQPLDITLGGAIKRAIEQQEADGNLYPKTMTSDAEKADFKAKYTMGWTIAVNLAVAAAGIAAGCATLAGAGKVVGLAKEVTSLSGQVMKQAAQLAAKLAGAVQIISDAGGAASMVTKGGYGVAIALITFESKQLDNQRALMDTMQTILSNDMQSEQNHITNRMKDINEMFANMADLISIHSQSKSRIVNTN